MPVPGLSLLGFMEQQEALSYMQARCIFPDMSQPALLQHWCQATARRGQAVSSPENATVEDLDPSYTAHTQLVMANPRYLPTVAGCAASFKTVEIAPLLAFQFDVEDDRIDLDPAIDPTDMAQLLPICLPTTLANINFRSGDLPHGFWVKSRDLNLRLLGRGNAQDLASQSLMIGMAFGAGSPFVQVVRVAGRCYLRNGYHRARVLLRAGATHMPCLFLETADPTAIGAIGGGATFTLARLAQPHPPTVGHFTDQRAYAVTMRRNSRLLQVTWSEMTVPEDD